MAYNQEVTGGPLNADTLRMLFEESERLSDLGSYLWDAASRTLHFSRNAYLQFGFDPDGEPMTIPRFFDSVHEEDRERVEAVVRAAPEGPIPELRFRFVRPDGEVRHFLGRGRRRLDEKGELTHILGTSRDITDEREEALARMAWTQALEQAQQVAHVGSWVWDPDHGSILWSNELYRITGIEPGEPQTVDAFDKLIHPDDRAGLRARREATLGMTRPQPHECRMVRKDGTVRTVRIDAQFVEGPPQRRMVGVIHDVTETRQLEERLKRMQVLEAAGRLASGVAHDFNNLLSIVLANTCLLDEELGARPEMDDIRRAAQAGQELTQRLMTLGRPTVANPTPIDLSAHVQGARTLLAHLGPQHALTLATTSPIYVFADPKLLDQVLINVVLNAIQAMPEGGTTTLTTGTDGTTGWIDVTDTGVGIEPEDLPHVVEPFFTTKGPTTGTGLGLSMVQGAMDRVGGSLALCSEIGQGTTVRLSFRVAELHDATSPTILVVDDDAGVRNVVRRILDKKDFEVLEADGPVAAFAFLQESVDLVLCDIVMPDGGGEAVWRTFQEKRPGVPFIFMSGYHGQPAWLDGQELLAKPFRPRGLIEAIQRRTQLAPNTR